MRYLRFARLAALLLSFASVPAFAVTDVNVHIASQGEPVPGATVTLLDSSGTRVIARERDDDGDGAVAFPGISGGDYRVSVHSPDGANNEVAVRVPASGAVTVAVPFAPLLSYNYLEADYIADFDLDDGNAIGLGDRGDGYWLQAAAGLGRYAFVKADAMLLDIDTPVFFDESLDWLALGPGARLPLHLGERPLDLWGQVSYDRASFAGMPFDGYGLAGGLRLGFCDRLEVNAWYRHAWTEADDSDLELNPEIYGLGLVYKITPSVALTATYAEGELEIEDKSFSETSDFNLLSLGLRVDYGGGRPAGQPPSNADHAQTVSYDYLQAGYVFDGELEDANGDSEDTDQGVGLSASRQLTDHVIVGGSAWTLNFDDPSGGQNSLDMYEIGPGLRFGQPVGGAWLDAYGMATLDRVSVDGIVLDGYGAKLGLRLRPARLFELDTWVKYSDTDTGDLQLQTTLFGASVLAYPCDRLALELGYTVGDGDVESGGMNNDIDLDFAFVGLRYYYDSRTRY